MVWQKEKEGKRSRYSEDEFTSLKQSHSLQLPEMAQDELYTLSILHHVKREGEREGERKRKGRREERKERKEREERRGRISERAAVWFVSLCQSFALSRGRWDLLASWPLCSAGHWSPPVWEDVALAQEARRECASPVLLHVNV